ncbi:hypothetical protein [Streptomyces sp. NBC_00344]|uniref:hypothetical protein n=1 Tax=Streptomyces sp. NBC_00344 TaxID=2975720 RepID=UPI002E21B744
MHRLVRTTTFAAAGLMAALVISGCSSSDDNDSAPARDSGTSAPTPSATSGGGSAGADAGGAGGTGGAKAADVEGSWVATTAGKSTVMVIQGRKAVLLGGAVCSGTITDAAKLSLKCPDGNTDRTAGSVESADGKTLSVSWNSGVKDTFRKTDGKKIPGDPSGS